MGHIGPLEIAVIVAVALLLFGGSRIASIGKGLGEGIRNFKKGIKEDEEPPKQLPEKNAKKAEADATDDEKHG